MKIFLLVLFLLLSSVCISQTTTLDSLPQGGLLLDKSWKFITDDNSDYANPDYDDKAWQPINPTLDIHDSLPQIPKSRICWFRLHFKIDSANMQPLVLLILQSGASEIYLNGKLIQKFGVLNSEPDKIKAFNPIEKPVPFPINNNAYQVLAVRFALQPHVYYSTHWFTKSPAFSIIVNTYENGFQQYKHKYTNDIEQSYFRVGVLMILGILYLTFFLFHIDKKVNLYFFLYALLMATVWYYFFYAGGNLHAVALYYYFNNAILILQVFAFLLLLTGVYNLLRQTKKSIYYLFLILAFITIFCGIFIYGWGWQIFGVLFSNLVNFDILRVAIISRKHKEGASIIMSGAIICVISWVLSTAQGLGFLPDVNIDFFSIYWLSIPVAVSIYLGYDFALVNRSLQNKLIEVENLFIEKQEILASQNETLEQQVTQRTAELNTSLSELKSTQAQLIQSEKMASLGELTAGIAHEIQNPLNFVNNFSEVNKELINEMQQEIDKGNYADAKHISNDIKENEEKINHHGKRADAIVKGMLQHSKTSLGKKELTTINTLADEYLRLSYHGFRAKDKNLNVKIDTDFDESIGEINVVPQDIGKVFLNLYNNAFYACAERSRSSVNEKKRYEPTVTVQTKKINDKIEIRVSDNGNGIPQNIVDKIFQPFFTTKPTGQGTGLGLSLSYDIVKAHSGEIKVDTKEGEGTTFKIQLPM